MSAPICPACGAEARLTFGAEACPDCPDLADAPIWACTICDDTWAECHPGTEIAIGAPADAGLREARATLIARRIEPIVRGADHPDITRDRLTGFLACHLGIERAACDPRLFTIEQCREAWSALAGGYDAVRLWSATYRGPTKARAEARV